MPQTLKIAILCAAAAGFCAVPSTAADAKPVRTEPAENRQAAVGDLHKELDTLGQRIDALQQKADSAGAEAKRRTQKELNALEAARKKAALRLDSLEQAGSERWEDLKDRAGRELDSLKIRVDKLKKKIKG